MKKIFQYAALLATAAALMAACDKAVEPLPQDGTVMHVTIPSSVTKVSLTDRTSSGGGMALAWEAGDAIRVISGSKAELFSIKDGFSGHAADFTGNAVNGSSFDIIYPGTFATLADVTGYSYANQTQTGNGNTDHLVYHTWLTGVDTYTKVAFSPDWAAEHGGALHQCGVLKMVITLPSSYASVKKVTLVAPSEIFRLDNAGTVKSSELALNLSGVDVSTSGQILTAYMNIPAQDIALSAGLELTVNVTAADNNVYTQSFTVANDVTMQGGKLSIIRLEPEVVTVLTDYYVGVLGSGARTGEDWNNALDINQFKALVRTVVTGEENPSGQETSNANAAKLDGATFHFADGTYVLPDAENERGLKIEYNGYTKQVDLTFVGTKDAVLSGDNLYRVLLLGNQVNLTINGMTVANGYRGSESGGGILVSAGASGHATLNLNGTCFEDNKTDVSYNGGAIRCSKGTIVAKDCEFGAGNYARNGGSLYTDNNNAHVTFTDCTFKSHSYNTGGASNNSKGTQIFKDCLFEGCYTEAEKGNGGAIHANAPGATVSVTGCTFSSCKASTANPMASSTNKGAGIISVQQAEFTLDDCLFEDCEAVTGALIFLQSGGSGEGTGGLLKCNNTRFIGNRASDRGLIQVNGSKSSSQGSIGLFNNCVFYGNTMRTNQWGFILHGGNPGIACFNNCTIYGNDRQQTGGNGVLLNNDGLIVFTNSTLIGAADLVAVRNTDASNNARVLLANSIIINTSTSVETPLAFGPLDKMKCPLYVYHNLIGPAIDDTDVSLNGADNVYDATLASLGTGGFDTGKNVYTWDGPAATFNKITPTVFEAAVKESLNVKYGAFNAYIGENTLGELYYGWLGEIGALGKDALGTARGDAWWPGAYQK